MNDDMPVRLEDLPPIAQRAIAATFGGDPDGELDICGCLAAEMETGGEIDCHAVAYMGMLQCKEHLLDALEMFVDSGAPFECDGCGAMSSYEEGAGTPGWFVEGSMLAVMARACPACLDALASEEEDGGVSPEEIQRLRADCCDTVAAASGFAGAWWMTRDQCRALGLQCNTHGHRSSTPTTRSVTFAEWQ